MNENPNSRSKKRRRKTSEREPAIANIINHPQVLAQERSHYPAATVSSPQTVSPEIDSSLRAEAPEEKNGLLGYVHDMEKKQKRYLSLPNGFHDSAPRFQEPSRDVPHQAGGFGGFTPVNGASRSVNGGHQAPQAGSLDWWAQPVNGNLPVGAPMQSSIDGGHSVHLIDTLPKIKQRKIFGLISGIQGGIDHLQKQLNLLQASLGIEIEGREKVV